MTTLWAIATGRFGRRTEPVSATLLDRLTNGRRETAVRIYPFLVGGQVVLEQGMTSEKVFVSESRARTVRVERTG